MLPSLSDLFRKEDDPSNNPQQRQQQQQLQQQTTSCNIRHSGNVGVVGTGDIFSIGSSNAFNSNARKLSPTNLLGVGQPQHQQHHVHASTSSNNMVVKHNNEQHDGNADVNHHQPFQNVNSIYPNQQHFMPSTTSVQMIQQPNVVVGGLPTRSNVGQPHSHASSSESTCIRYLGQHVQSSSQQPPHATNNTQHGSSHTCTTYDNNNYRRGSTNTSSPPTCISPTIIPSGTTTTTTSPFAVSNNCPTITATKPYFPSIPSSIVRSTSSTIMEDNHDFTRNLTTTIHGKHAHSSLTRGGTTSLGRTLGTNTTTATSLHEMNHASTNTRVHSPISDFQMQHLHHLLPNTKTSNIDATHAITSTTTTPTPTTNINLLSSSRHMDGQLMMNSSMSKNPQLRFPSLQQPINENYASQNISSSTGSIQSTIKETNFISSTNVNRMENAFSSQQHPKRKSEEISNNASEKTRNVSKTKKPKFENQSSRSNTLSKNGIDKKHTFEYNNSSSSSNISLLPPLPPPPTLPTALPTITTQQSGTSSSSKNKKKITQQSPSASTDSSLGSSPNSYSTVNTLVSTPQNCIQFMNFSISDKSKIKFVNARHQQIGINDGAWTEKEHADFMRGLNECGKGRWREIAEQFVLTRTRTQVASHARKYLDTGNTDNNKK